MGLVPGAEAGAYPAASLPFGDILTKVEPAASSVPRPAKAFPGPPDAAGFEVKTGRKFSPGNWHPQFYALAVLAELSKNHWPTISITARPDPVMLHGAALDVIAAGEIAALRELAETRREGRLTEIIAQADDARPYWSNLLMAGPAIGPYTWTLVEIGHAVGQMVVMHYKMQFNRPRPVQIYPAIMPPILTPPHPAYPNAHALQSLLMSQCATGATPGGDLGPELTALAERVGENREIAGVHFPSDRVASKHIATKVFPALRECSLFQQVEERAKLEWTAQ